MMTIRIDGPWFKDDHGRTLHLRGVNLGGSSKVPTRPDGATHLSEGFFDHRAVSFVGRPFPLASADEHFERLRTWGLTFLRFLVTWEAIEHAGPGQYDTEYLDYVQAIVEKAYEYDMRLFIDPHQDVWSRFTGGDGAPGWTLEAVGLDMRHFKATAAAIVHQTHGDPFPRMIWPSNYSRLAAATLFTLFFAGDDFAPATRIEGVPVQQFLQGHYFRAIQEVAKRLKGMPHVLGYDTLNEPSHGYIGHRDVRLHESDLRIGLTPTPYQGMLLGAGYSQTIMEYDISLLGIRQIGEHLIDPGGVSAWLPGRECVWRENGVWDIGTAGKPRLLRPDHFHAVEGRPVNFAQDYLRPFANRYAQAIREIEPNAMIFFEPDALGAVAAPEWGPDDAPNVVYAPHWYDGITLFLKRYIPFLTIDSPDLRIFFGRDNVRRAQAGQIGRLKHAAQTRLPNAPLVIGEIGIPYDLNNRRGFTHGDFRPHIHAVDDYMRALETNLANFTLWNYTADNTNARGDLWNGEDLSIFSPDQQTNPADIHSGGRALEAVVRPYPLAVAGEPLRMHFDIDTGIFEFTYRGDPTISAPTEFYVPHYQYPSGYRVEVLDGTYEIDEARQRLIVHHTSVSAPHFVRILPVPERTKRPGLPAWLRGLVVVTSALLVLRWLWPRRRN